MPNSYTTTAIEQMNSVSAEELPIMLVQIDNPALPSPVRVTNAMREAGNPITHNGDDYIPLGFTITPPDDLSQGIPRARISIDNVGGELMEFIELSNGGMESSVTLTQVLPSDPNTVQWQVTGLALVGVSASSSTVEAGLTYEDLLSRAGVVIRHTPERSPGLYS